MLLVPYFVRVALVLWNLCVSKLVALEDCWLYIWHAGRFDEVGMYLEVQYLCVVLGLSSLDCPGIIISFLARVGKGTDPLG
jgi:hypothetical protein